MRCQRVAKILRRIDRERSGQKVETTARNIDVYNPTLEQLAALSLTISAGLDLLPTVIHGTLPEGWTPPSDIVMAPQVGFENTWLMIREDPADKLLRKMLNEQPAYST